MAQDGLSPEENDAGRAAAAPGDVVHGRFAVGRKLGEGTFGAVHAAEDLRYEHPVAIKQLQGADPGALVALKREFRVLRDVRHPNLVQLYELFTDARPCFFTMELVRGRSLATETAPMAREQALPLIAQIADGLAWLHRAGLVHGDVKPSNVLLRPDGRVVLCDFGLSGRVTAAALDRLGKADGGGTLPFQAPETRGVDGRGRPEADWYALGVLIFRLFTGRLPFEGDTVSVERQKVRADIPFPVGPAQIDPDVEALISALLRPDPARRGGEAEVRALTGPSTVAGPPPRLGGSLVGRSAERRVLAEALAESRGGRCSVVEVAGPSGMGKSALLEHVAAEVDAAGGLVLAAACHLAEHVPLNAFDGVADALSHHLASSPEVRWPSLPVAEASALVTLFPVMGRVLPVREGDVGRPGGERRLLGIDGLRRLLARVAGHRPVLLVIDDVQWADADSRSLLRLLLAPPAAPPVLVVLGVRSDLSPESLHHQLLADEAGGRWPSWRRIELGPLPPEDTRAVVVQAGGDAEIVERAVAESGGHPFLAVELARYQGLRTAAPMDLNGVLRARVQALDRLPRLLLRLCAVAGHPLPPRVALAAAGLGLAGYPDLLALQSAHLLRAVGDPADPLVDTYHDRIRAVAAEDLPPAEVKALHLLIADAALVEGVLDPTFLTQHLEVAGEDRRAARYAADAADRALDALAFAAAAHFYGLAAALGHGESPAWELRRRQGAAYALAGDGVRAAESYTESARLVPGAPARHQLRREAAEQWLRVGRVETGTALLREVLGELGIPWPKSLLATLWYVLSNRVRLRLFGVDYEERVEAEVAPEVLSRTDATWTATLGLNMLDLFRSAAFQAQHTRLALRAGEPGRVARALSVEAVYIACEGGRRNRAFADGLFERAHAIAERTGIREAAAFACITHGAAEVFVGRPQSAFGWLDQAEAILRDRQVGAVWELLNCRMYRAWAWWWRGDFGELVATTPALAIDARSRGDVMAEVVLASGLPNFTWLVLDDPEEAGTRTDHAVAHFPVSAYGSPHYFHLVALTHRLLYVGEGEAAWRGVVEAWPRLRSVLLLDMQYFRVDLLFLRARAAIAAGPVAAADARRQLARLAREDHPVARPLAAALGAPDATALRAALPALDAAGLGGIAAAARVHLGEPSGWEAQGVVDPLRLARVLLPRPG